MNLNFIELLTSLQPITTRNSSDGITTTPHAIKKGYLSKENFSFYT